MGIDYDDRLLRDGFGLNINHEKKFRERILQKSFLPSFNGDETTSKRYHYTSPAGLMGILKTRTFYFTDSQFLNDFREKININSELDVFWNRHKKKYTKEFYDMLNKMRITQYEDTGFSYIDSKTDALCRYFVFSTSTSGDSLTMWKYYTKNDGYNGYCIGLFSYALVDEWIDRITGVAIISNKVEYYSDDKQAIIERIVDRLYEIWMSYEVTELLNNKIIQEFTSWMSVEAMFFKEECFADEQESRYIAIVPSNRLKDLSYEYKGKSYKMYDFRDVNGVLTPYLKMPFNDWNRDVCWAIDSIGIGPSANAEQKKAGIQQFLKSLDYTLEKCDLYYSKIPVRY